MTGFYQTPNLMIPLNDRENGQIAEVALEELGHWQEAAQFWTMARHEHKGRPCWCCTICDPCETLWFVNDLSGKVYTYTDDEILALKVAHLRQCHPEGNTWTPKPMTA
jgi:hypothetical protein